MTDPISDMLTRIRNAQSALLKTVEFPHSKMKEAIAKILKKEGYIGEVTIEGTTKKKIKAVLKYSGKQGIIVGLSRVSTPGLRRYVGATEIPRVLGGMGISIVSTSQGVMSGEDASKNKLGGELLCKVW